MSIYKFNAKTIEGKEISLEKYKDKLLLIVNTASKCGFTPQYEGLQNLYEKFKNDDFFVLGFPCNQFAFQEPGTNQEIKGFCEREYKVTFPMFQKTKVRGKDANPLFKYLVEESPGLFKTAPIKWNFEKFLVNRKGEVVERFSSVTTPQKIENHIKQFLS